MTVYQAVVVGTDGSESSLRAVDRAAEIAAEQQQEQKTRDLEIDPKI